MIFFRLIKNAFMTIMTVITFNFGWYKYNLIIKAAEFITSQSQYILFPLRFSPQKFSKWEKYRNFFLRKKAWQEECKLPFYKPLYLYTIRQCRCLQLFQNYIYGSHCMLSDTHFGVETFQHKLNTQNGKFQATFLVETRKHILIHRKKSDTLLF